MELNPTAIVSEKPVDAASFLSKYTRYTANPAAKRPESVSVRIATHLARFQNVRAANV